MSEPTPAEILLDLRDVHLPEAPADARPAEFAAAPLALLAAGVAAAMLLRRWRGARWRREARRELARIGRIGGAEGRRDAALALARRIGPRLAARAGPGRDAGAGPPAALFLPPARVGPAETAALLDRLRRAVGQRGSP